MTWPRRWLPSVLALGAAASLGAAVSVQRAPAPADRPLVVLAAGDSMTAAGYPDELQALCDAARLKVRVVNAGVKGHTSGEYLAYLRASGALARTRPDVVLLQLGTNDVRIDGDRTETARFHRQMNEILDRILAQLTPRGEAPAVLLSTVPPVVVTVPRHFDASSARRVVDEINPTIRRLARERGLGLVETYELFVRHPAWLLDIHPTPEGYRAMARLWFEALAPLLRRRAA